MFHLLSILIVNYNIIFVYMSDLGHIKIGVIGAGPSGSAVGAMLAKAGANVTVFEKVAQPGPIGAGVMLQRSGLSVLKQMGLLDRALALGKRIDYYEGFENNKKVISLSFKKEKTYGLGIHRGAVFQLLYEELQKSNAIVKTGVHISKCEYKDNSTVLYDGDKIIGEFDLVICCAGANNRFRNNIPIVKQDKKQEVGAIWTTINYHDDYFENKILQYFSGTKNVVGFMPLGHITPESKDEKPIVNLFYGVQMKEMDALKRSSLDEIKKQWIKIAPNYKHIYDKVTDINQLTFTGYGDVVLKKHYYKRMVFIGDAAHAMSPQLSAGISMALLDAKTLVSQLSKFDDIDKSMKAYSRLRKGQLKFYQPVSRFVTHFFQSKYNLGWVRNNFFSLILKLPFVNKIALNTILGRQKNLFKKMKIDDQF